MFRTGFLSIIRILVLLAGSGWNSALFHPDLSSKQSAKPIWHIPIAVYTVLDSWWWRENLSETCRVLFQTLIWKISASRWFYYKNISRCRSNSFVCLHRYSTAAYLSYKRAARFVLFCISVEKLRKLAFREGLPVSYSPLAVPWGCVPWLQKLSVSTIN